MFKTPRMRSRGPFFTERGQGLGWLLLGLAFLLAVAASAKGLL